MKDLYDHVTNPKYKEIAVEFEKTYKELEVLSDSIQLRNKTQNKGLLFRYLDPAEIPSALSA